MADYPQIRKLVLSDPNLGKIRDDKLAKSYGVSKSFVAKIRNELGIDFQWKSRRTGPKSPQLDKVKKYSYLLGKYSDRSIADNLNVHKETVRRCRVQLGIRAHPSGKPLKVPPLSDEEILLSGWKPIPERVGLTKNEWRRKCASN